MNTMNTININTSTQFKGLFSPKRTLAKKHGIKYSASALGMTEKDVVDIARSVSVKKWYFFRSMAERYNSKNFYNPIEKKEDPKILTEILKHIKKPKQEHFEIINAYNGSFENLKRIFDSAGNDKKALKFVLKANYDLGIKHNASENLVPELLESPNHKEYIKHYADYRNYLLLNHKNENAVKELDEMVNAGSINFNEISTDLLKNKYKYSNTQFFNADIFAKGYNQNSISLFKSLESFDLISSDVLTNGGDKALKEIFLSTNKNNFKMRNKILWIYNSNTLKNTEEKVDKLNDLNYLFTKIDNDKHVKNFITDMLQKRENDGMSISELNEIIDSIPALKLDIFKDNVWKIVDNTKPHNRLSILQDEITNPFYESQSARINRKTAERYGFKKRRSIFSKAYTNVINNFRILEYNIKSLMEKDNSQNKINNIIDNQKQNINVPDIKPVDIKPLDIEPVEITPENIITTKAPAESIEKDIAKPENTNSINIDKKAAREAAKAQTKQNIFDIINSKLGFKTLEKQRNSFGENATKIRLNLLPEIFASIAETRKTDRMVGKTRSYSSNKDVLSLYMLINQNNKKYINYMLKKRNVDNTRMFEVKDIIDSVKNAEAKIAKDRKANPNYRANDARKYYNKLYEAKIQQYGKIKRTSNKINTNV